MPRIRPYPRKLAPLHEATPYQPWRSRHQKKLDKRDYLNFMMDLGLGDETSSENDTPLSTLTNSEDFAG